MIVAHDSFISFASVHGVASAPRRLCDTPISSKHTSEAPELNDVALANEVLDFVIAWKFLFPMLSDPTFEQFLETQWSGFISEFKDTFISLVMRGPFPDERRVSISSGIFRV